MINKYFLWYKIALILRKKKKTINRSPVRITSCVNIEVSMISIKSALKMDLDLMKYCKNLYNCQTKPIANGSMAKWPTIRFLPKNFHKNANNKPINGGCPESKDDGIIEKPFSK